MSIEEAAAAFAADMGQAKPATPTASPPGGKSAPVEHFGPRADEDELLGGGGDVNEDDDEFLESLGAKPAADSDDPEVDEDEDEDDPESDEDEDEDEGEDEDPETKAFNDQKVTVIVDGQEEEVTVRDALNGYIRTQTFHRRMNQVNDAARLLEAEATKIVQSRDQYLSMLDEAESIMKELVPEEPDWDALFAKDPAQARSLQKQYGDFNKKIEEVRSKRAEAIQKAQQEEAQRTAQFAQTEFPKFAQMAKWKSKKDMERDTQSMRRTAMSLGFSEDEIAQVYDSRMLGVLLKASKYDRMMANKPKPVQHTTSVRPGAGNKRTARTGPNRAQRQLAKTGSVDDAAAVFQSLIKD